MYSIHIILCYTLILFILSAYKYYQFRRILYYKQMSHDLQRTISECILPTAGLCLTDGDEVTDEELNDEQASLKQTANRYGFKVRKL